MSELSRFLKSGKRAEEYFHIRRGPVRALPPKRYGADEVRGLRAQLGASQSGFASILAVSIKTLQSWEQGVGEPPPMACRLLELIAADQSQWRARLQALLPIGRKRAG